MPGVPGAGPAARFSPSQWAGPGIQTPAGSWPLGHRSPSVRRAVICNYFYYYHYFSSCSDSVGAARGRRGAEPCSLPAGLAPALASWQGSDVPEVSTFPGPPCREAAFAVLGQEGGLPDPHTSGLRMDVPGQGTARCHFPAFCRAGAVHPPPSRGRAVPHASCDRCAGRGTAGSALRWGGRAAPAHVGSGSQTAPGAVWHLGAHMGMLGTGQWGSQGLILHVHVLLPRLSSCCQ